MSDTSTPQQPTNQSYQSESRDLAVGSSPIIPEEVRRPNSVERDGHTINTDRLNGEIEASEAVFGLSNVIHEGVMNPEQLGQAVANLEDVSQMSLRTDTGRYDYENIAAALQGLVNHEGESPVSLEYGHSPSYARAFEIAEEMQQSGETLPQTDEQVTSNEVIAGFDNAINGDEMSFEEYEQTIANLQTIATLPLVDEQGNVDFVATAQVIDNMADVSDNTDKEDLERGNPEEYQKLATKAQEMADALPSPRENAMTLEEARKAMGERIAAEKDLANASQAAESASVPEQPTETPADTTPEKPDQRALVDEQATWRQVRDIQAASAYNRTDYLESEQTQAFIEEYNNSELAAQYGSVFEVDARAQQNRVLDALGGNRGQEAIAQTPANPATQPSGPTESAAPETQPQQPEPRNPLADLEIDGQNPFGVTYSGKADLSEEKEAPSQRDLSSQQQGQGHQL